MTKLTKAENTVRKIFEWSLIAIILAIMAAAILHSRTLDQPTASERCEEQKAREFEFGAQYAGLVLMESGIMPPGGIDTLYRKALARRQKIQSEMAQMKARTQQ